MINKALLARLERAESVTVPEREPFTFIRPIISLDPSGRHWVIDAELDRQPGGGFIERPLPMPHVIVGPAMQEAPAEPH